MPRKSFRFYSVETFQIFLITCSALFLILMILVRQKPYFTTDLMISQFVQNLNEPPFVWMMNLLSEMGTFLPYTAFCIGSFVLLRIHNMKKASAYLALSIFGSIAISLFFKMLIARPRPDGNLINQVNQFYFPDSFPSQHVLEFIGLFGFLLFISFTKIHNKTLRLVVSTILLFLLSTIGLSRVYLGAHWFTDVLGSYLIGFVWLGFIIYLYRRPDSLSHHKV